MKLETTMAANNETYTHRPFNNNLIVDFPSQPTRSPIQTPSSVSRKLSFSTDIEMKIIPALSAQEIKERWYSSEEKKKFKSMIRRDVFHLRNKIASGEALSASFLYECVGIEPFLSEKVIQLIQDEKAKHSFAVMQEQAGQRRLGMTSEARIARVAEKHSQCLKKRAHELAVGYMEMVSHGSE